ncbi:hypothetical protein B0H17DRAFT_1210929 [Mycena rosella]|uniref:F-box domain-containing protein n=1 Tax=Mycena rosella TaxID=1033263 RepID=A0AAD7CVS3_MYCRO|nr:hypothetical protein B0H17DRAFT_1210929 [Mycena rosella]
MSNIDLLPPDLMRELMLRASSIHDKFAPAQVSQLWRNITLDTSLLWSSLTGRKRLQSRLLPGPAHTGVQRLNHDTACPILFFPGEAAWAAHALQALVPYVPRLETLDVEFPSYHGININHLLDSDLQCLALHTLRSMGPEYSRHLPLSLSTPQLPILDLEHLIVNPTKCDGLFVPTLEDFRLSAVEGTSVETLAHVFTHCPLVWCFVLHSYYLWNDTPDDCDFRIFDLERILKIGFSDTVLEKIAGSTCNGFTDDLELLTVALLPDVGCLVCFEMVQFTQTVLRDNSGRTRQLDCCNDDGNFEIQDMWRYLSVHYDLHQTIREIWLGPAYWEEYAKILHPPQSPDDITLGINLCAYLSEW